MVQLLKRDPIKSREFIRLTGLTDLELSKTTSENYEKILDQRIDSLGDYDDLTPEEVEDIQDYRVNVKNSKRFGINELIDDLND